jgi:glycopeptide antibiotics resistance protein
MFLNTIKSVLSDNYPILTIFIVTLVTLRFFYIKSKRERVVFYKEFFTILGVIYIFLLFHLVTKVELNQGSGYNLIPFAEIFRYEIGSKLFNYNVLGNIGAFIVFGIIVAVYIKPKNIFPAILTSLIVSTTIEFVQINIGRSFDVDDIILNVLGGIIGYLLYIGLSAIKNHLPGIFKNDTLYNIICFILLVLIIIYLLKFWGVVNF